MKRVATLLCGLVMASCQRNIKEVSPGLQETLDSSKLVCFSPNPECTQRLVSFIRSAKKSLDVAVFQFTEREIGEEILLASQRIPVRIIVDQKQSRDAHSIVPSLLKQKVNLRFGRQKGIMHHKFIIVDDYKLETGSFNFTRAAGLKNQENQIYTSDPQYVLPFVDQFKRMWNESHVP